MCVAESKLERISRGHLEFMERQNTMTDTTTLWIVLVAGAAAVLVAFVVASRSARAHRARLRQRFGPEYDRALAVHGNPARAERELDARAKRAARFHLHALDDVTRGRFATSWNEIQARFVDNPAVAVREANALIKEVMLTLGYPASDFDQRTADLSVHHPNVIQHYRAAHALAESNESGQAQTEDLRQAVVHYRALFSELIGQEIVRPSRDLRHAHA
jgi:hypothetical protein